MINQNHKDRLFIRIFGDKGNKVAILELYNALNGTHHTDVDKLEITTLENVIYMGYKNDVSFILDNEMYLCEHQSKYNPNMPLRGLIYCAKLYEKYIAKNELKIYDPPLKKIPTPHYYVFYNGVASREEHEILRLSDAFEKADDSGAYEWTAHLLNINLGKNEKIMKHCKKLEDYAILIDKIRCYKKELNDLEQAVNQAVDECIAEERLKDFLLPHKSEVVGMILTEWNEEEYIKGVMEDSEKRGEERGVKIGEERGIQIGETRGEERGIEIGEKRGKKNGRQEMTIKHYLMGYLPLEVALEETRMAEDEFQKAVELYQQDK